MALTDEQIGKIRQQSFNETGSFFQPITFARAIEAAATAAATAPLLEQIAQLEQQLAEAKRQMESQKDEWLAWDAKRTALEKDAELIDWLENNLFHRDPDDFDLKYGACKDGATTNWQIYAPKGTQGSARVIIRAAIARTQEQE